MKKSFITNGRVLTPGGLRENATIVMEGPRIAAVGADIRPAPGDEVFDASGALVAPGLCDIHIHGAGGHWGFTTPDDIAGMSRALLESGVTAFCPATVSLPHGELLKSVGAIREAMAAQQAGTHFDHAPANGEGARILGANLEGPWISLEKPGAHNPMCIREPKEEEINDILDASGGALRVVTVAPEIKGGMELIRRLADSGVVVSIGHTNATRDQLFAAGAAGARLLTHLFNAMRSFHHREPGAAFAGLLHEKFMVEIIADGHHIHPDNVAVAVRLAGPDRAVLVTDSVAPAGMPDGAYSLWGFTVEVKDGKSQMPNGTLAGSVLTLNRAVANVQKFAGADTASAFRFATANPYRLLGLHGTAGALAPGQAADIAIFDDAMKCRAVFLGGKRVFKNK